MAHAQAPDIPHWHGSFKWHWAVFLAAATALAVGLWRAADVVPLPPQSPGIIQYGEARWYFIIRLPEAPWGAQGTRLVQTKTAEWLKALTREGFHPMLFSEVTSRFQEGTGVPDKTVVIVFEPGYQHTYETLEPVLAHYQSPAVWLTNHEAMQKSDARYVSRHDASRMVQSRWWDVIDSKDPLWAAGAGRTALNWGGAMDHVNRLNVNVKWSGQELVNRLLSEVPLQGRMQLTVRPIQGRLTGVLSEKPGDPANAFHLEAPLTTHSATMAWPGTQGSPDARIDFDVPSWAGDFVLVLRADAEKGESLRLGYSDGGISIVESRQGKDETLALIPARASVPREPLRGTLTLSGDKLELLRPGTAPLEIALDHAGAPTSGTVQLTVYDKLRGAAFADSIHIVMTPLSPK